MEIVNTPLQYCHYPLERWVAKRRNSEWLERQFNSERSRFLPLWNDKNLVSTPSLTEVNRVDLSLAELAVFAEEVGQTLYLGESQGFHYFAVEIDSLDYPTIPTQFEYATFKDLRQVGLLMAEREASLCAYARGLLYWHRHHRYCGLCGHDTVARESGHVRTCLNSSCQKEHFPRIDPAVIMMVKAIRSSDQQPICLLGRNQKSTLPMYSTLAGYVEHGENLEQTVRREVHEEVGISLDSVHYFDSQPWPFPGSFMIGFIAETTEQKIIIDTDELSDARWFTRDEVAAFGEYDDPDAEYIFPRRDSIARHLIQAWYDDPDRI
jgi:NAD+ diphosphatase